jgi:hypothetical protein
VRAMRATARARIQTIAIHALCPICFLTSVHIRS